MSWVGWVYLGTALPWVGCLLLYGVRSPWRSSRVGLTLMVTYASLAGVLLLAATLRVVHPSHGVAVGLVLGAMSLVAVAGVAQLTAILRAQRKDRRDQP